MHPYSATARAAIQNMRASPIREVANAGMGKSGVLPFWFGEPDEVTPAFIRQAAVAALEAVNTSCTPGFVQRAGIAAITGGEAVVARTRQRFADAQPFLVGELSRPPRVEAVLAPGAIYAFFRVDGMHHSLEFCTRLVSAQALGLAPGIAFGPEGGGYLR